MFSWLTGNFAQFLYATADVSRPSPGQSWSSVNTSELLGSSVISLVQLQQTNNSHRINRRSVALRRVAISFLSVTAIMSQQQSHGPNKKQLLRKPKRSESRQMDLRCSWFLTFCSKHSTSAVLNHADVELLAGLLTAHVSEKELSPTRAFTQHAVYKTACLTARF